MADNIRKALEVRLAALAPALATAYENTEFEPVAGVPYQRANMIYATPDNQTLGCQRRRELGIFQVSLCYPSATSSAQAHARADLTIEHFKRGLTLSNGGINVLITTTPSKTTYGVSGDRYIVVVSINYSADVFG
jgi:hypothetical protein